VTLIDCARNHGCITEEDLLPDFFRSGGANSSRVVASGPSSTCVAIVLPQRTASFAVDLLWI